MFFSPTKTNRLLFGLKRFCLCACSQFFFAYSSCQADQFVLFDVTFEYSKTDADNSKPSKSHYYVKDKMLNENRPKDWTAPVDYRNGTVHVRLEVLEKPTGDEPTTWSICYITEQRTEEWLRLSWHRCVQEDWRLRKRYFHEGVLGKRFDCLVGRDQANGFGDQGQQRWSWSRAQARGPRKVLSDQSAINANSSFCWGKV